MLERTKENMSELRRNAIRRKSAPKKTGGSSAKECPESSGECSGQMRPDSPLMGLSLSCHVKRPMHQIHLPDFMKNCYLVWHFEIFSSVSLEI